MRADKELAVDDFLAIKKECEISTSQLEKRLLQFGDKEKGVDELINRASNHPCK